MKKTLAAILMLVISSPMFSQKVQTPDQVYGQLFKDVQMAKIFPDGKTFVDCVPKKNPKEIVKEYLVAKNNPALRFSLKLFVEANFDLPKTPQLNYVTKEKDVMMHIKNLWGVLKRDADISSSTAGNQAERRLGTKFGEGTGSSLLPLPYPYIVPGGRFREIYYWDSYFTMLGLKESGENEMIENMIKNFAYLIETYGHIPNGNRSYYIGRSQPPFFAAMVQLLASIKGDDVFTVYLPALENEYAYWMDGAAKVRPGQPYRRVVKLKDGAILNRYWDDSNVPRQESYREDIETAAKSGRNKVEMYKQLRAGAESGIDFSNRWFADGKNITSIQTTNYIAIDLNSLLYNLELVIAKGKLLKGDQQGSEEFRKKASTRQAAIDKYCWNKNLNYYTDYNFKTQRIVNNVSLAGMYPFCFFEDKPDYLSLLAKRAAEMIRTKLLKDGGVVTVEKNTNQQWDAPNGWAPLQWMTVWGLDRCGQKELAGDIAKRWVKLNNDVFLRTGKMMEKYNVVDTHLEAGGGEYPGQDGFGWTNGVLLALIKKYELSLQNL